MFSNIHLPSSPFYGGHLFIVDLRQNFIRCSLFWGLWQRSYPCQVFSDVSFWTYHFRCFYWKSCNVVNQVVRCPSYLLANRPRDPCINIWYKRVYAPQFLPHSLGRNGMNTTTMPCLGAHSASSDSSDSLNCTSYEQAPLPMHTRCVLAH